MKTLFILNKSAYGSEESYNALRLAGALAKREKEELKLFFMSDAVTCSVKGQKVPEGFYNLEVMLKDITHHNNEVGICCACMDARGITDSDLIDSAKRSTLEHLTDWTLWADKVLVF